MSNRKQKDLSRKPNAVVRDSESGTTSERDFGKTDRYANQDEGADFNFRTTGDGSSWDNGRQASISEGSRAETETRAGDAKTPSGPKTKCGPPK